MEQDARDRAHWEGAEEGAELVSEGEHALAITELTGVIQRQPDNPYAFFFLGSAFFETGDPARALKSYLSAVELRPTYLGALIGAGWSLHALGRYREALRVGKQVLLREKEDGDALYLLGLCHYALGDRAASLDYLNRFLSTRPEVEVALEVDALIKVLRGEMQPMEEPDDQDD